MVQRCAVLGHPIEHSLSPVIHQAGYQALGLDWVYERIESTEAQFPEVVAKLANYRGLSVTMPNKFAALRLAASSSERARLIGSANTLVRTNSGWYADNTDGEGLLGALAALGITDLSGQHVLIIGGGGTARPALWAVSELGASTIDVVNRSDKSVELAPLATRHGAEFNFHDFHADLEQLATSSRVVISTVPSSVLTAHVEALAHTSVLDVIYEPRQAE